jgi:gamma-glutamyltranspeptidase/glutathione hydrolase
MSLRASVMCKNGMVSSSHPLASLSGINVLQNGGNVVDAAIATSATLCVVQNNLCGLGGDLFALLRLEGKTYGLNGSGRAGEEASIDFYLEKGFSEIPKRGPLAALTVPGIVDAWGKLRERFGSWKLSDLLKQAVAYAREGFPLTNKYIASIASSKPLLESYKEWANLFLVNGEVPQVGYIFRQESLGKTLSLISEKGVDDFYRGELCKKIVKGIREQGGIITEEDFAKHESNWDEPLKTEYRGVQVYETAPNSQGATVLLWLNMLEEHDLSKFEPDSADLLNVFFNTCSLVYRERALAIGDPAFHQLPDGFTTKNYAKKIANKSRITQLGNPPQSGGDTTYFAVADSNGNCASVIQSNYMGFGSGLAPHGTGLVLQNRGCYFTLNKSHHNSLYPGKRTFHTLCASIGVREEDTLFALGSMGGDVQPQIQVQLITKLIDLKMDVQSAIDYPRWVGLGTIYDENQRLFVEHELKSLIQPLEKRGHSVSVLESLSSTTGHAQAIVYNKYGAMMGGADPRGDGEAIGF